MTTPAAQLEIAAQWLPEGALALRGKEPADRLYAVADDCERAAGKPPQGDQWVLDRKKIDD